MVDVTSHLQTAPIWMQLAGTPPEGKRLESTHMADLVVVGGGIAGLAAAYYATTLIPGMTVAVVEADHVGSGTTGRSTGIVTPGMKIPLQRCRRIYGDTRTRAAFTASLHGVELVRDLVRTEAIDCDARDEPHVRVALTNRQRRTIAHRLRELRELGFDYDMLTGAGLANRVGNGYLAGQSFDTALLVDPYRLALGLADALRRRGVEIFEHSRVTAVDPGQGAVTVSTREGRITARRVLLATNGSGGDLDPHPTAVTALRGCALATVPLTTEQLGRLGWDGRGAIIDERHFFNHYRLTADRRLLLGGGPLSLPGRRSGHECRATLTGYQRLHQELRTRFPGLEDVPIAAQWTATEAATLDRLPVVGPVPHRHGVYYAGSWNGHGLSTAVAAARQFAQTLQGEHNESIPWHRSTAPELPIPLGRRAALATYLRVLDTLDHRDMRPSPPQRVIGAMQRRRR